MAYTQKLDNGNITVWHDVRLPDGRTIKRNYGTFTSQQDADWRRAQVESGEADRRWEEPE